jgi:hypothetical protein
MSQQLIHRSSRIRRTMSPRHYLAMFQTLENREKPLEIFLGKQLFALSVDTNRVKDVGDRVDETGGNRDSSAQTNHSEEGLWETTFVEGRVRGWFVVDYGGEEFCGCFSYCTAEEGEVREDFAEGANDFGVDDIADSFAVAGFEDFEEEDEEGVDRVVFGETQHLIFGLFRDIVIHVALILDEKEMDKMVP